MCHRKVEVMHIFLWEMALGMLIAAAGTDLVSRRVPNELIILGMITGGYLTVSGVRDGNLLFFLWRLLWPILLLYPLYLIGGLGAGDVKLLGCLSLFLPAEDIIWILMGSFIIGGIVGFLSLIKTGQLFIRCGAFLRHLCTCLSVKKISVYNPKEGKGRELHFAVCMLCSAILCFLKEELW